MCAYSCRAFRLIWRKMGSSRPLKGHRAVNSREGVRENRFPAAARRRASRLHNLIIRNLKNIIWMLIRKNNIRY